MTDDAKQDEIRSHAVAERLAALDPSRGETADPASAYARVRGRIEDRGRPPLLSLRRLAALALPAAAVLASVIFYAPAREALAGLLDIFRVRQFNAISIREDRFRQLEPLRAALESGELLSITTERKAGPPREVADAQEASAVTGFRVLVPSTLPAGAERTEFAVLPGPAVRAELDPERIRMHLERVGLGGIQLAGLQPGTARVEVPWLVQQKYVVKGAGAEEAAAAIWVTELPSPEVVLPAGTDAPALGEAMLQLAGLPAAEARRLAQKIDWTSTLVIPMPENLASFREVDVAGSPGLFVQSQGEGPRGRNALLWERDGIVCSVHGENVAASELLRVAESMR